MSKKEVVICDGCGRVIESRKDRFKLCLTSDKFWNVVEMDWLTEEFDFCPACARNIKETLEKIARKLEKEKQNKEVQS